MTFVFPAYLIRAIGFFLFVLNTIVPIGPLHKTIEVNRPTLGINFYLMNRDTVNENILTRLKDNVEYMNHSFSGMVNFEIEDFHIHEDNLLLPDLHNAYRNRRTATMDSIMAAVEIGGTINIFIFDSYVVEALNAELMGFTPVLKMGHRFYEKVTPRFDRIYLSYSSIESGSTLVHEMGHFLGLQHPWELNSLNQQLMGLNSSDDFAENHMSYGLRVSRFTKEQLERMQHFASEFRSYLIHDNQEVH